MRTPALPLCFLCKVLAFPNRRTLFLFADDGGRRSARKRRQLKFAFDNDLAIYSAHLPLDLHPEVGNNVRAPGFEESELFFEEKGSLLERRALADAALSELINRSPPKHWASTFARRSLRH